MIADGTTSSLDTKVAYGGVFSTYFTVPDGQELQISFDEGEYTSTSGAGFTLYNGTLTITNVIADHTVKFKYVTSEPGSS